MVEISKAEAHYLANNHKMEWKEDLLHTYTRYRKYYIKESDRNLKILAHVRSNKLC